jgi:hypothetical protein
VDGVFKIDGDTIVYDFADDARPGLFLKGPCTFVGTSGAHGNLGTSDVDVGDDVPIPSALGELGLELKRIPPAPRTNLPPEFTWPGAVGVVVALMEENSSTDAGAAAGRAAFNSALEQQINTTIIPNIAISNPVPRPEDIAKLRSDVHDAVKSAIVSNQGFLRNLLNFFNGDFLIQADFFLADEDALRDDAVQEISKHLQRIVTDPFGTTGVHDDYKLTGEILGIEPSANGHQALRRSHEHGTPPATGTPATCLLPALGVQNTVYRDTSGRLHELWRDAAGRTGTTDLTAAANAPTATGNPHSYLDSTAGLEIVVYRGNDANIHSLYRSTGAVGHDNLTGSVGAPKSKGNPVGYFEAAANTHHVIYRGDKGHLHELWWAGAGSVGHGDLTPLAAAPAAVGDPVAYLDTTRGVSIVVYHASDGHIHSLYWSTGPVGHDALSGFAGTPPATGDPAAYYTAHNDAHQVTYRGGDGRLYELWWLGTNPVSGWELTAPAGAPPAVSDPAAFYSAATNTKHVIYRSANNHLNEIWWVPGMAPAHVDLTLSALAHRAADKPAAYTVDATNSQHVIYRATDNEIREIRWNHTVKRIDPGGTWTWNGDVLNWHRR